MNANPQWRRHCGYVRKLAQRFGFGGMLSSGSVVEREYFQGIGGIPLVAAGLCFAKLSSYVMLKQDRL